MRIVSHKAIKDFYSKAGHADSEISLERWFHDASDARWQNFNEVRQLFPSADYVGNGHYVFNISGNKYRLVSTINFRYGMMYIRFIGTHTEYETINARTI